MRMATGITLIIAASATMAQGQSLQEQATCAQQAKAAFQDYKEGAPPGFGDYQSHYNKELNECLILINQKSELNGQPVMATDLYDAVERRWLASYTQLTKSYRRILVTGGSGGSGLSLRSDDLDSVVELYTADDFRQLVVAAQTMPTPLRGLRELEDHSECGLVREATP